ncbi:hypothetical protein [Streptacidiphilus sp. P02-A3a]|uniref:hypothetical protein n=1 Tax=Streptacidiphilus sp. P02-A3a TaxID=2704468 RepID=UPI0015FBB928|nr:hypothetical protein [Streptacidiphilus sp. P02-A3a]QMU69428.1 hypothetical protein GXP74_15450 [Streptacidiphilus sp. P02-A3a]
MRLTKGRLAVLVSSLLAVALALFGVTASATTASASTTRNYLVTLYGWPDNSPPGNAIAYPENEGYPTIHNVASGTGTYADPITFATDEAELPVGTIVYYPYLHRYFINEDDCTECDEDWTGSGPDGGPGLYHIDLWINGQNGNSNDVINCEDNLTQNSESVISDPPSTEPVDTTPLFNSSSNSCYDPSSFTGGGGGGGSGGGGSYPATSAALGGSAALSSCSACADGQKVSDVGGGSGGTVTFSKVSESASGSYQLSVSYLSVGKARPAKVTVNGTAQTVTFAETSASSYSVVGTQTVTVQLKSGSANTVEFSGSGTAGAPDIAGITV